jgi:hypothetical protein
MPFLPCRHWWARGGKPVAIVLAAWAVSNCGSSSLKTRPTDAAVATQPCFRPAVQHRQSPTTSKNRKYIVAFFETREGKCAG